MISHENASLNVTKLDPEQTKALFPIFNNNPFTTSLSYLDNAATSQKPESVLQAMEEVSRIYNGPIHRGFYALAEQASAKFEQARKRVMRFIGAQQPNTIVFTASATESINMIARGFLLPRLHFGQTVWVTRMEHHANYLPWQEVCAKTGANLRFIELNSKGELDLEHTPMLFSENSAMIAITHTSNVLGVINDVQSICEQAKKSNIPVLIDAAQALVSNKIDVNILQCDFLVCSAHKMFGPNGIGLLYIAPAQLAHVHATKLGGGMVDFIADEFANTQFGEAPHLFEAGSGNLTGAVGFASACEFVDSLGQTAIKVHLKTLATALFEGLSKNDNIYIFTPYEYLSAGIVSFYHKQIHVHDLAQIMGDCGVAVRAGHHCAQPLLAYLKVEATLRISISVYNTISDIEKALESLDEAQKVFA